MVTRASSQSWTPTRMSMMGLAAKAGDGGAADVVDGLDVGGDGLEDLGFGLLRRAWGQMRVVGDDDYGCSRRWRAHWITGEGRGSKRQGKARPSAGPGLHAAWATGDGQG